MKLTLPLASLLLLTFASSAYAQMEPESQDLQIPPGRLFQKGFSLTPLDEKGWKITQRNPYQLILSKPGKNPDEEFVIQALVMKLPLFKSSEAFVQQVKEVQVNGINLTRVALLEYGLNRHIKTGKNCVRSHISAEAPAASGRSSGKTEKMISEAVSLTCAHPKKKQVGINVTYAYRYYPGKKDPAFLEKAEKLIASLKFTGVSGI
jgi:hypothetical protein